jgi:hypothetical protein
MKERSRVADVIWRPGGPGGVKGAGGRKTGGGLTAAGRGGLTFLVAASAVLGGGGLRAANYALVAWSEAGLHELDGTDVSVFSLAPPYSTIYAQLVASNLLVLDDTGYTVTYEAVADGTGSINRTSQGKANFFQYAQALWGIPLQPDQGLAGFRMPGPANTPQAMLFDPTQSRFAAIGIPITPYDDQGRTNRYPLMRLVARDSAGNQLASTEVVLPVTEDRNCRVCHGSGSPTLARPAVGWAWDADSQKDYKRNILQHHDEHFLGGAVYSNVLLEVGYNLAGLVATVTQDNRPVLCLRCHSSEAFPGTGATGMRPLTEVMHSKHAYVPDPQSGVNLGQISTSDACLRCHALPESGLLRGRHFQAMDTKGALAMQCQSCHGAMTDVGLAGRRGWLEEPQCQSCHTGSATVNNGQIWYTNVFDASGLVRQASNPLFSTQPDTPEPGLSLYRESHDHGFLACAACHGPAHAEVPTLQTNDNVQNLLLQGQAGILVNCTACHTNTPAAQTGGPHGMHPANAQWAGNHNNYGTAACQNCHGFNLPGNQITGTELSRMAADRTFNTTEGGNSRLFWAGSEVGCWDCHAGPGGPEAGGVPVSPPTVLNSSPAPFPADTNLAVLLQGSDPASRPLTYRIVTQPAHGTVSLSSNVATYFPAPGWVGADTFTFCARNGYRDSNLGHVNVQVNPGSCLLTASVLAPLAALPGSRVPFRASATLAACAAAVNYSWDFGDGSPPASLAEVSHSYPNEGDYPWTLTVTAGGTIQTVTNVVTISSTLGPPVYVTLTSIGFFGFVSWPWDRIPVSLETTFDLTQPIQWQQVTDPVSQNGPDMTVLQFMIYDQQYFRLRRLP